MLTPRSSRNSVSVAFWLSVHMLHQLIRQRQPGSTTVVARSRPVGLASYMRSIGRARRQAPRRSLAGLHERGAHGDRQGNRACPSLLGIERFPPTMADATLGQVLQSTSRPRCVTMARNSSPPQRPTMSVGRSASGEGLGRPPATPGSPPGVTKGIIDPLEVVQIDHQHAKGFVMHLEFLPSRSAATSPGSADWATA